MYRLRQFILLVGDATALYLGLYLGVALRYLRWPSQALVDLLLPMSVLFILAVIIIFIVGLYDIGRAKNTWKFYQKIFIAAFFWIISGVLFFYIYPLEKYVTPKTILLLTAIIGFGFIAIWRFLHNRFLSTVILKTNVVFVGLSPEAKEIIELLQREPQRGYNVVGLVDPLGVNSLAGVPAGKNLSELTAQGQKNGIHLIIISPQFDKNEEILKELYRQLFRQAEIVDLARFYEEITGRIPPFTFSESWFLTNIREQQKKIYDRLRNLIDYSVAVVIGVFFLATFPFIALAIKLNSRGPIFFIQERVGWHGKNFKVLKFRTMQALSPDGSAETAGPQFAAKKDYRATGVGRFLRRARLDEIPQFINILKGEMSIVGPRPERPEFVKQLTEAMPFYPLRHLVKPGLTGWAQLQVSYYGTIDENLQKLQYDLYYIKNRDTIMDIVIVLRTINILVRMMGR